MALRLLSSFRPSSLRRIRTPFPVDRHAEYHDYIRFSTPNDRIGRIPLRSPKVIGVASSRGERIQQEDFYAYVAVSLDPDELRLSLKKAHRIDWDTSSIPDALARQVLFVGIYDGHGGSTVSQFLRQELHGLLENVDKSQIPDMYDWIHELGGYFKRFTGGALAPWIHADQPQFAAKMDLEARATLAFFEVDKTLSIEEAAQDCGATASVVLLQSLDNPVNPFFSSERLALTVAHVGDTRVLLSKTDNGEVVPMTENHHVDARVEAIRLRRGMGSGRSMDSFGETRWMGALQNTRSLGDLKYKRFGVTPEPQMRYMLLHGPEYSHITLVSDGISSVVSDDEISDLARGAATPQSAAQRILKFADEMGSDDNLTALVVPLAGWGRMTGEDRTRDLRYYRKVQMSGSERHRPRWM
ncbi:protein serine/threonine phosphatase 2C [Laetiporus sulphureus 93-53]|uniref:Protein serine/threonine phosphatase 2C n=1 Tax=Laetiporus sulphureus 93-53 TaxID=1314785 RepID=A0A165DYI7_9APHY|nr:protein serine/threonine phosphatase 2C [Laetiporus sulphureus 93-53]KZT05883.1 protein serine/threonine phosphatase 2C [Laetiporus sulphureus 93-53]